MSNTINRDTAIKVLEVVDAGLVAGMGKPIPGRMCVEAAVCYAMGLPHSDEPTCVSPAVRALKITLNDSDWSSPTARAKGMRRIAIAQLGSADAIDDREFAERCALLVVNKYVPKALRHAAELHPVEKHKQALIAAAVECESVGSVDANAAADAAAAAADAARAAARAADAARAAAADAARAADSALAEFAEDVVSILIDLKSPGTEWLDLAPVQAA